MDEDSTGGGPLTDLFGDPWTPARDPRGRKRHRRNPQLAEMIAVLRATGSTVETVAQRTGLSEPTLRKYYLRELEQGTGLARQVLIKAMWDKAMAGNVSAAKFIRDELSKGDNAAFIESTADRERRSPQPPRLGKKEAAAEAALTAGEDTDWGDDLKPSTH